MDVCRPTPIKLDDGPWRSGRVGNSWASPRFNLFPADAKPIRLRRSRTTRACNGRLLRRRAVNAVRAPVTARCRTHRLHHVHGVRDETGQRVLQIAQYSSSRTAHHGAPARQVTALHRVRSSARVRQFLQRPESRCNFVKAVSGITRRRRANSPAYEDRDGGAPGKQKTTWSCSPSGQPSRGVASCRRQRRRARLGIILTSGEVTKTSTRPAPIAGVSSPARPRAPRTPRLIPTPRRGAQAAPPRSGNEWAARRARCLMSGRKIATSAKRAATRRLRRRRQSGRGDQGRRRRRDAAPPVTCSDRPAGDARTRRNRDRRARRRPCLHPSCTRSLR